VVGGSYAAEHGCAAQARVTLRRLAQQGSGLSHPMVLHCCGLRLRPCYWMAPASLFMGTIHCFFVAEHSVVSRIPQMAPEGTHGLFAQM
jgi:hypothetical protein